MDYYFEEFRADLDAYCRPRCDAWLLQDSTPCPILGDRSRVIRFGTEGWLPAKRREFAVCLYFAVLADQMVHARFPAIHPRFDAAVLPPKLMGLGVFQRLRPSVAFDLLPEPNGGLDDLVEEWRGCCDFFIRVWMDSLPSLFGIEGVAFLRALVEDEDLAESGARWKAWTNLHPEVWLPPRSALADLLEHEFLARVAARLAGSNPQ